jgi:D-threonate/D-erythronate kinase
MSSIKKIESLNNSPFGDGGITVIADDFSGAAELAGICLRYGLSATVCTGEITEVTTDVLLINTNSRSLKKDEALVVTEKIILQVQFLQPKWVYKKTDSVLRGHIIDELKLQMKLMDKQKAFFMPANPSLGRTISNGIYFVNNVPLHETGFAADPEFPIKSSFVKELLQNEVGVLTVNDVLPVQGIVTGEVNTADDYTQWANKAADDWLLAGTGDFFTALLRKNYKTATSNSVKLLQPHLYICGTAFEERIKFIAQLHQQQQCVMYLNDETDDEWLQQAATIINAKQKLVIAINNTDATAAELRIRMATLSKAVIKKGGIKEIFIEGGSTAAAVLEELGIKKLIPVNELSRGVVRMKAGDLFITVKPGSYQLPEEIKKVLTDNTDEHR